MKYSKVIALSAVSAALAVIFIAVGAFVEIIDIVMVMAAGVAIMLPLAKKYYLGGFLAYLASAAIGAFTAIANPVAVIIYAAFFGLYPVVNALQIKYRLNKIVCALVKDVWFLLVMFLYYEMLVWWTGYDIFKDFAFIPQSLHAYLIPGLFIIGAVFFLFYDSVMLRVQFAVNRLVEKLKL